MPGQQINGSKLSDHLFGSDFNDLIKGLGGDDRLEGSFGDDVLQGGAGADVLDGGADHDTADYSFSNAGVLVNLAVNVGLGGDAQGDRFFSIENVDGSGYSDTLGGDGGDNRLRGAGGNDILNGLGGDDTIEGGDGADTMMGGAGIDALDYRSARSGVTVGLVKGDAMCGDALGDTTPNYDFEDIYGGQYGDQLYGSAVANSLKGRRWRGQPVRTRRGRLSHRR